MASMFDAHWHAFRFFEGVPGRGIYDNMKTAVDKVGLGKKRDVNARFTVRIPRKLGAYSTRSWALIPRDRGQPFHAMMGGWFDRPFH
jgi:hypothetical protein